MISLRAFGPLTVVADGAERTVAQRRERALLAMLVVGHGQPVPVDRLVDQLWAGDPPPKAHTSLQVAVSRVRALLEPGRQRWSAAEHIVKVGDGYALRAPESAVDVWRFAAEARRVGATAAGDRVAECDAVLAGWSGTPYADCADTDLVRAEVDRLVEARLAVIETRAEALLDLGHADLVARELAPVARDHPFREGLWSLLALGQYQSLRQADALATLRTLRERLADELGVDPSARVRELEQDILRQSRELAAPERVDLGGPARSEPSDLVGRDGALAVLSAAVDRLAAGRGGAAIISGEAGIGKSRLVAAVREYARQRGVAVSVGRCHEADVAPAYWPWLPIVRDLAGPDGIGPLLDADGAEPGPAATMRTYDALARLLAEAAGRQPRLVVIEDLHWADASSLRALAYVVDAIEAPILFVATRRTTEPVQPEATVAALASMARSGAERVHLDGLASDDVSALLGRQVGAHGPALAKVVADRTGGNPFFVIEFGRLLRATGVTDPDEAARIPVPDGIGDVLRLRLRGLPADAHHLLAYAAVAGRDIDASMVAELARTPTGDVLDALDAARAAGLVATAGHRSSFVHDLVRETLYADLPAGRRARLHAAVAGLLENRLAADPEIRAELAHHYRMAAPLDPAYAAKAVEHLAAAGRAAESRHAIVEAAELWRQAVEVLSLIRDPDPVDRLRLLTARARAAFRLGEIADAHAHVAEAMAIGRSVRRWDLAGEAATVLTTTGVWSWRSWNRPNETMIDALRDCLDHLPDGPLAARVLGTLQMEYFYARRIDDADDCGRRSVAMARATGDPDVLIRVLVLRALGLWGPGNYEERIAIGAELLSLPVRGETRVAALYQYAAALHHAGRPAESDEVMHRCRAAAADLRHTGADVPLGWWRFMRAVEHDDPDRADVGAAALDLHRRTTVVTIDEMGGVYAVRSADPGAAVPAEVIADAAASRNPGFRALVAYAMVEAGDVDGAVRLLGPAAPGETPDYAALAADCLRTAVFAAAGRLPDVRVQLDRITRWSGDVVVYGSADHLGAVDFFIAAGLAALGERDAAIERSRAAVATCERVGNVPWTRRAARQLAALSGGKSAGSPG